MTLGDGAPDPTPKLGVSTRGPLPYRGGAIQKFGDPAFAAPLVQALEAQDRAEELGPVHRFHSYPARMHPALAQSLLSAFHPGRAATVLDPFCGSGTVLLEAAAAGWRGVGADLNPLALSLSRTKCMALGKGDPARLRALAQQVSERSLARVQERAPAMAKLSPQERAWYAPHVLKELAGLLEEIRALPDVAEREALRLVFSAIVVKFSQQRADTREERQDKRIRKGLASEFFARKAQELAEDWKVFAKRAGKGARMPTFVLSDARRIAKTLGGAFFADFILTSPPYAGTYDYARHHARRCAWLGISTKGMQELEIGARRDFQPAGPEGRRRWDEQLSEVLGSLAQIQPPESLMVWLLGDGEIGQKSLDAREHLQSLVDRCGYELVASAQQARPDPRQAGRVRQEHLIAMMRNDREVRTASSGRGKIKKGPPRRRKKGPAR